MEAKHLPSRNGHEDLPEARPTIYLGRISSREMVEVTNIDYLVSPEGYVGLPLRELAKAALENGSDSVLWMRASQTDAEQPSRPELSEAGSILSLVGGAVQINFDSRDVNIDGEIEHFANQEFKVLEKLAENMGIALTRAQIQESCWGSSFYQDRLVDVNIVAIRKRLGKYRPLIKTKHGYGYLLQDITADN
jgi:DNA-binding response OmpR family regulator